MATYNEWQQIYHNNLTGPPQSTVLRWSGDVVTEVTTVTTSTTTATSSPISDHLSRVARPTNTRRRSRVSRRTPTTLLNTDTSNFRAMVQQFTGGNGGGGGVSTQFMATTNTTISPRQPLSSYNTISSGSNYHGTMGLRISPPATAGGYNLEFRQPEHQQYYSVVANKGGADGVHQHGFVQRVEEGGANINSGDAILADKNTTFMF